MKAALNEANKEKCMRLMSYWVCLIIVLGIVFLIGYVLIHREENDDDLKQVSIQEMGGSAQSNQSAANQDAEKGKEELKEVRHEKWLRSCKKVVTVAQLKEANLMGQNNVD